MDDVCGHSLLERLVDGGIGVQAGRTGVHELGGVMWGHRGHVVGLRRVGYAWHDRHDLCDLLLQLFYLLLLLQDLTCVEVKKDKSFVRDSLMLALGVCRLLPVSHFFVAINCRSF